MTAVGVSFAVLPMSIVRRMWVSPLKSKAKNDAKESVVMKTASNSSKHSEKRLLRVRAE